MDVFHALRQIYERPQRKLMRALKREIKHRHFPSCGERAQLRYGRQVAEDKLRVENGLLPFVRLADGRLGLTNLQLVQHPELRRFVKRYSARFEFALNMDAAVLVS